MSTSASKRTAFVTGASYGVGAATALALAQAGLTVAISATRAENLESILRSIEATGAPALPIVLDLRSPQIPAGDIEVSLDIDHALVKLLVPEGAVLEHGDARRIGRCRVKDWTGTEAPEGRRIVLTGELRNAEVRVHRGGVAILSAMCSREYLADALQARRTGAYPTIDDPSR